MSRTLKLIFASLLLAGLALMGTVSTQARQDHVKPEDLLTSGTPLSAADKKHLLEDNFVVVKTVAAIPQLVQEKVLGIDARGGMVAAGQPYQATDVIGSKPLPFRRLIYAGTAPGYCFVYNENGGFAAGQAISLYRLLPEKATLVWQVDLQDDKKLLSLLELRSVIAKGKFRSLQLPVSFRVY